MNKTSRQVAIAVFGIIAFFFLVGIAGTSDYRDAVISSMSENAYVEIIEKVGSDRCDIVEEYMKHRDYYDLLQ